MVMHQRNQPRENIKFVSGNENMFCFGSIRKIYTHIFDDNALSGLKILILENAFGNIFVYCTI